MSLHKIKTSLSPRQLPSVLWSFLWNISKKVFTVSPCNVVIHNAGRFRDESGKWGFKALLLVFARKPTRRWCQWGLHIILHVRAFPEAHKLRVLRCYRMLHKTYNAASINIGHFTLRYQLTSRFISSYSETMDVVSVLRPANPKSLRLTVFSSFQKILGLHHKIHQDRFFQTASSTIFSIHHSL